MPDDIVPAAAPGELVVTWGRADAVSDPCLVYAWPDRDGKSDVRILARSFEDPLLVPDPWRPGKVRSAPSLAQELEARGYDLSTLRFSISKKAGSPASEGRSE